MEEENLAFLNLARPLQNETLGNNGIFNLTKDDIIGMEFINELDA